MIQYVIDLHILTFVSQLYINQNICTEKGIHTSPSKYFDSLRVGNFSIVLYGGWNDTLTSIKN